ncbi:lambda protein [Enterocloster phage PMBT24]|jgi:hypothetical protein|uniref:Lambda protein n=1 Tax=Enterocloster phage PMBT24 TaxID=3025413 RepID=A0AAT9TR43_9CAUD|nr:lambda protein [Enterocloster phage PMBT24]
MTLGELQKQIDRAIILKEFSQMYTGNIRDKEVLITLNGKSDTSRPSVKIASAGFGKEWESSQFRIEPVSPIILHEAGSERKCNSCKSTINILDKYCKYCGKLQ